MQPGHLSGSTDGKPIVVAATASPGTLIHTAVAAANQLDYMFIEATNNDTVARTVTLEWGDAAAGSNVVQTLPPKSGLVTLINGLPLQNGATVKAFGSAANVISIVGRTSRTAADEGFN